MVDTPAAKPDASKADAAPTKAEKDDLLEAAQLKAKHVDRAFLKEHGLDDEYLAKLARGEEPPPPYTGPEPVVDLHRTDGGWQITPKGVKPGEARADAISR